VGLATLAGLLLFACVDAVLFRSDIYSLYLEPESTTGRFELFLHNEMLRRPRRGPQVIGVGDSRMPLMPRIANELRAETGLNFASIAVPGTSPRCWYYALRDVDPDASRYAAVVIPLNDYSDQDSVEDPAERMVDLHYVAVRLRLGDVAEFAASYTKPLSRWQAFRGSLFKGFIYQRDFQEFLLDPQKRIEKVEWMWRDSAGWFYNYPGDPHTLRGLEVDYASGRITYPAGLPQDMKDLVRRILLQPAEPQTSKSRAYRRKWLGKIVERYRDSVTRVVFLRLPRSPIPRPGGVAPDSGSVVRSLKAQRNVVVLDEHLFDSLERPELFMDPIHLNGDGCKRFSRMLAEEMKKLLGS
jgi:hypothetical protein